jgi:hypothetical protein
MNEAELGLAILWIQQALVSAYEDNCLRPVRTGRKSLRWTMELESLRKEVRWLFNKCRADKNPHSWNFYRESQQKFGRGNLRPLANYTFSQCRDHAGDGCPPG